MRYFAGKFAVTGNFDLLISRLVTPEKASLAVADNATVPLPTCEAVKR